MTNLYIIVAGDDILGSRAGSISIYFSSLMVAYNMKALDPSSLREVRFYPRVIKYDQCECGDRKLEKSPKCSSCKNKENGKKVGNSNLGRDKGKSMTKIAFYSAFELSFAYLYIYYPLFLR